MPRLTNIKFYHSRCMISMVQCLYLFYYYIRIYIYSIYTTLVQEKCILCVCSIQYYKNILLLKIFVFLNATKKYVIPTQVLYTHQLEIVLVITNNNAPNRQILFDRLGQTMDISSASSLTARAVVDRVGLNRVLTSRFNFAWYQGMCINVIKKY